MYAQGGGEKLLNEAVLNCDFSCLYLKSKVGPRSVQGVYLAAVKLQSCVRSPAWECAVWAGSTAALQLDSWTAGTLQLETHCWPCNLVFLEHTRGTHDCGVVGSNAVTSG